MKSGAVANIVASAATVAKAAPRAVSMRPIRISRVVSPLSAIALCWKKSIHGVTVAPMFARRISTVSCVRPPGKGFQVTSALPTVLQSGCDSSATGTNTRLNIAAPKKIRSHVQYRCVMSATDRTSNAPITATAGRTPKNPSPARIAMNSVTRVKKLPTIRSTIENQPQERAEAIEDQFRMSAMSGRAQAHGHLLHYASHQEGKHHERHEEADAKPGPSCRIGEHAGTIVLAKH